VPARLINIKYITICAEKVASPVTALHRVFLKLFFFISFYRTLGLGVIITVTLLTRILACIVSATVVRPIYRRPMDAVFMALSFHASSSPPVCAHVPSSMHNCKEQIRSAQGDASF